MGMAYYIVDLIGNVIEIRKVREEIDSNPKMKDERKQELSTMLEALYTGQRAIIEKINSYITPTVDVQPCCPAEVKAAYDKAFKDADF